ncbi:hypothetical protein CEXT_90431 [Caerostris extrusa]|uniref:Uncharacterized protein n=1 Tax=Caerostris extrusa TaxID=172846 RepID=A0AAV4MIG3_CAEEX|nr:hypothetical protein CEXT_90431 [Caerostris extrusa]
MYTNKTQEEKPVIVSGCDPFFFFLQLHFGYPLYALCAFSSNDTKKEKNGYSLGRFYLLCHARLWNTECTPQKEFFALSEYLKSKLLKEIFSISRKSTAPNSF